MYRILTDRQASARLCLALALILTGCAASKDELLPHGEHDMLDIWQQESGIRHQGSDRRLLDARQGLRRGQGSGIRDQKSAKSPTVRPPRESSIPDSSYTRSAANEIRSQFHRLPNPDLVMYVFPHLAGSDPVPVPGYSTVFPLYRRAPYALPGERLEEY